MPTPRRRATKLTGLITKVNSKPTPTGFELTFKAHAPVDGPLLLDIAPWLARLAAQETLVEITVQSQQLEMEVSS